MKIAGSAKYW